MDTHAVLISSGGMCLGRDAFVGAVERRMGHLSPKSSGGVNTYTALPLIVNGMGVPTFCRSVR